MLIQIHPIDPLVRPPVSGAALNSYAQQKSLNLLACRNEIVPAMVVLSSEKPVDGVVLEFHIPGIAEEAFEFRQIGSVPVPEVGGPVSDFLLPTGPFLVEGTAPVWISLNVPQDQRPGVYTGEIIAGAGAESAALPITVEILDIAIPEPRDWSFFLNVWMNPATVARWHGVELWSEKHWALLDPYVRDLALHGQKTAVVPIAYQPWRTQTYDPYPNVMRWRGDGVNFDYDFTIFDRYVEMHLKHGISRAIHCYSIVQAPGDMDESVISYNDKSGQEHLVTVKVGTPEYAKMWAPFLGEFVEHLRAKGWLDRTYLAFDEKPGPIMEQILAFVRSTAPELKISVAVNTRCSLWDEIDDISYSGNFNEHGMNEVVPEVRQMPDKLTTFYVCCGPPHPNTFIHSPLAESRMLPWLSWQGGYHGFLRWSYNDWPENPFEHPEWSQWPTGDVLFVYPGEDGPLTSLRWEQLRCGIQDFELIRMAARRVSESPEGQMKLEEAVSIACKGAKSGEVNPLSLHNARETILRLLVQV